MEKNIILVDADYVDRVAFDLIVNFERMIGRAIPAADLAHWLDCIALDGGIRAGENAVQVFFIHSKSKREFKHFSPAHFSDQLHEKAFKDHLAEFTMSTFPVEELVSQEDFIYDSLEAILSDAAVERVMLVADFDGNTPESIKLTQRIKQLCSNPPAPEDGKPLPPKAITLFAMEQGGGRGFVQEILGYSLMAALGISSDELR